MQMLFEERKKIRVNNIEGPIRLALLNDARYVNLAGT